MKHHLCCKQNAPLFSDWIAGHPMSSLMSGGIWRKRLGAMAVSCCIQYSHIPIFPTPGRSWGGKTCIHLWFHIDYYWLITGTEFLSTLRGEPVGAASRRWRRSLGSFFDHHGPRAAAGRNRCGAMAWWVPRLQLQPNWSIIKRFNNGMIHVWIIMIKIIG